MLYLLNEQHVPYAVESMSDWAASITEDMRRVSLTEIMGYAVVSTVFLGIDHNFQEHGDPILFETMVFFDHWDEHYQQRYSSWSDAEAGHQHIVDLFRAKVEEAADITGAALWAALNKAAMAVSKAAMKP